MNQPNLFDAKKLARRTDPDTSHAAARSSQQLRGAHHRTILSVLAQVRDANADEIAARCSLSRHQIGRRLGELWVAKMVVKSGATRPSASGRSAECYRLP